MKSPTTTSAILALVFWQATVFGLTAPAQAQRTINDCEQIQAADAYNQCLAKFGPPAKTLNVEAARPGDVKSGSAEAAAAAGGSPAKLAGRPGYRRHGRGRFTGRRSGGAVRAARPSRGGRKRMTITVGQ